MPQPIRLRATAQELVRSDPRSARRRARAHPRDRQRRRRQRRRRCSIGSAATSWSASLLLLHGLHPVDLETRVHAGRRDARPGAALAGRRRRTARHRGGRGPRAADAQRARLLRLDRAAADDRGRPSTKRRRTSSGSRSTRCPTPPPVAVVPLSSLRRNPAATPLRRLRGRSSDGHRRSDASPMKGTGHEQSGRETDAYHPARARARRSRTTKARSRAARTPAPPAPAARRARRRGRDSSTVAPTDPIDPKSPKHAAGVSGAPARLGPADE